MSLTCFYTPGTCALAGLTVLEWVGQPYRLCKVDGKARQTDAFKRVNPQAKVPALIADGHLLAENAAVLPRIARGRDDLVPPDNTDVRDDFNQWMSVLGTSFHVAFYPFYLTPRYVGDAALYPAVKEAALVQIHLQYSIMNAHLADRSWLVGAGKTVLDPYLYAMARWGRRHFDVAAQYPHVARHLAAMEEDAGLKFGLAIEAGETPSSAAFQGHVALDQL